MAKTLVYQVLPRLWKDGRFASFDEASLAYVRSLGMTHIWYTGILDHATRLPGYENASAACVKGMAGSPYSVRDYYAVAPYLGSMAEFEALVARTHAAGLKVIIDFVPNHVARENINFGRSDDTSVHWAPENDFYYYPGEPLRLPLGGDYTEFPAKASGNCFSPAPDRNDWWDTVRLNYCDFHTGTWDKMLDILQFWLGKGVDGFRCDMVELVPWQFLQWLIAAVKAEFPSALFIAEAYNTDTYKHYLETVGFDLLYDKCGLYDTLRAVTCNGATARGITRNWQMLGPLQERMLNFLENHDEQRVASPQFAGSPEAGFAALAVSSMLTDAPFMLYFGEEWGEPGGADGRTSIFEIVGTGTGIADQISATFPDGGNKKAVARSGRGDGASVGTGMDDNVVTGIGTNGAVGTGTGTGDKEKMAPKGEYHPYPGPSSSLLQRYAETLQLARGLEGTPTYDLCWCQGEGFDPDRQFAWLRGTTLLVANFSPAPAEVTIRIPADAATLLHLPAEAASRLSGAGPLHLTVPARDYRAIPLCP